MKSIELHKAHATTISASNAHKIMTTLGSPALPSGARAYIESMARGDIKPDLQTTPMQWGLEKEAEAIAAVEDWLDCKIDFTGENQRRFYYNDFISALPDGVIFEQENIACTIEIKCLNSENHEMALTYQTEEDLIKDFPKYCQIQTQLLCTGADYALLVYYDPRHITEIHFLQFYPDKDWRKTFLARAKQAHAYYLTVRNEIDIMKKEPEIVSHETNNLPRVQIDISEVAQCHKTPEKIIEKIRQQAGSFVFDMSISKGREACRSHAANIIKCITPALNESRLLATEAKKVVEADLYFRKNFEKGVREIAEAVRRPLTEWEAEQERLAEEQARIEAEAAERERLAKQYQDDWSAALTDNELFDLRKEKAQREAKEEAERKTQAKAEYERKLQEHAVERERQRIAEEQARIEAEARRKAELAEQQRQEAIARAERAELEKVEAIKQAELDKIAAERAAVERERAAIEQERQRQAIVDKLEAEEQARIKAEAEKNAANLEHRRSVNNDIIARLIALGLRVEDANSVVIEAFHGRLGALIIKY